MARAPGPVAAALLSRPTGNAQPMTVDDTLTTAVNIESTFGDLFLLGNWKFREQNSLISPTGPTMTTSVVSTANGIIQGFPITIK